MKKIEGFDIPNGYKQAMIERLALKGEMSERIKYIRTSKKILPTLTITKKKPQERLKRKRRIKKIEFDIPSGYRKIKDSSEWLALKEGINEKIKYLRAKISFPN